MRVELKNADRVRLHKLRDIGLDPRRYKVVSDGAGQDLYRAVFAGEHGKHF